MIRIKESKRMIGYLATRNMLTRLVCVQSMVIVEQEKKVQFDTNNLIRPIHSTWF